MFKFRYVMPTMDKVNNEQPILQVMQTHELVPALDRGDMRLCYPKEIDNPQWQTVDTIYNDAEYDKARGWKIPEPCMKEKAK